jgi:outer membrane receptor for ferrienterochelin and colicins
MRAPACRFLAASLALALPFAAPAFGQAGEVSGRVTDKNSGLGVSNARVVAEVRGAPIGSGATNEEGRYRITGLASGRYAVKVLRIGQQLQLVEGVEVRAGATTTLDIATTPVARELEQVITAASRQQEKVVDAPASVAVVTQQAMETRPSLTAADHLKAVPGVDVSAGGIVQSNIVARGFNNAFSGSLLTLQDYRFAGVPSLRVNVPFLFTSTSEDVERMEVVLGPAAALYGPNSSAGVLHVITKSPFDSRGTTFTVDGGGQSILRTALRHANVAGDKFGYKVSGEYMTGQDFKYSDPGEPTSITRGGRQVSRDFDVNRYVAEARVDFRPVDGAEFITTYGRTHIGSAIELTGANGASQVKNWTYQSIQQRMRWGRLFAQAFVNMSDAGNRDGTDTRGTFLLRNGQSIVDESRVAAGSIQHSLDLGERQRFVYGADYIWTNPRTGGTINGRNEDDDNVTEVGGYLHSVTKLTRKIDLVAALRADDNDRIKGTFYSPRAALVFKPAENQNFRITFDRAYSTPANFSFFLDLIQVHNPGGLPYDIRAVGVPPEDGFQYQRGCNAAYVAGYCMRSPFPGPVAPNAVVDANAAAYYRAALAAIKPRLPASLNGIVQILDASPSPTGAQVSTVLRNLTAATSTVAPSSLTDIEPLKASFVNNIELGYKGLVARKATVSVTGWYQRRINFVTPAQIVTPSAFMDPTTLGQYLYTTIYNGLRAQGMSDPQAQATAAAAAPPITSGLAQVPVGTVTFNNARLATNSDILFTYRNVDKTIALWGTDLGFDLPVTDRFSLAGTYSAVSKTTFDDVDGGAGQPLRLNAPQHKASLTGRFDDARSGVRLEVRGRYADAFLVNSGVYASGVTYPSPGAVGTYTYPGVPASTLLDAGVTYQLPWVRGRASWSLNGTNLLNSYAPTFIGVPAIGRLVMTRLTFTM